VGPRLLCFVVGAALSTYFLHMGLLATPFFGAGAFVWANVFACFLLALALGFGLGDLLATVAGPTKTELAAGRLAVAGGLAAWASAYWLPTICRAVLEPNPEWSLAPAVSMAAATIVPGALVAAVIPSELRCRCEDEGITPHEVARRSLRLLGLMTLGGVVGVIVSGRSFLRVDEADVWKVPYACSVLLCLMGLVFLRTLGRVVTVGVILAATFVMFTQPSEVQSEQYAVGLAKAWEPQKGASSYYLRTTDKALLTPEQLEEVSASVSQDSEKPGAILACELLLRLGEVTVTGEGLVGSLQLLLPEKSKPYLMPIFHQAESVRSDGNGKLWVRIKRQRGQEGARFTLPGTEPGQNTEFWFRDDFTVQIHHQGSIWRMQFGPLTVERAGVFELNDTYRTPLMLPDVQFTVDASLLGIIMEEHPDRFVLKAVAQGSVGPIQTVEVVATEKDTAPATDAPPSISGPGSASPELRDDDPPTHESRGR
jgi:hypothetical protein